MREDGKQQVCIVGLQEFEVSDVQIVREYIERGNAARSTGSTGANEESSRSHAILQLVVKKHIEVKDTKRNNDGNESKSGKIVGKISFIDLAGSERGADTTDNDRQTRLYLCFHVFLFPLKLHRDTRFSVLCIYLCSVSTSFFLGSLCLLSSTFGFKFNHLGYFCFPICQVFCTR